MSKDTYGAISEAIEALEEAIEKHHGCSEECYDCNTFPDLDKAFTKLQALRDAVPDALGVWVEEDGILQKYSPISKAAKLLHEACKPTEGRKK